MRMLASVGFVTTITLATALFSTVKVSDRLVPSAQSKHCKDVRRGDLLHTTTGACPRQDDVVKLAFNTV